MQTRFQLRVGKPGVWDDGVQPQLERIVDALGMAELLDRLQTICDQRAEAERPYEEADDEFNSLWGDYGSAVTEAYDSCVEAEYWAAEASDATDDD